MARTVKRTSAAMPDVIEPPADGSVPDGYLKGDDGKMYRKRIVAGVVPMAFATTFGPGDTATETKIEKAMADAVRQALDEGVSIDDSAEMHRRMIEAAQAVMDEMQQ